MEKKKLGILTVARSDFGLLEKFIELAFRDDDIHALLFASGTHLSPEYGITVKDITYPTIQVETLLSSDTKRAMAKSMGITTASFADAFNFQRPDALVVLGDRYEHLAAVQAAFVMNIPVVHIGGGETTLGSLDDAFRNAISHMAGLHFVYSDEYSVRIQELIGRSTEVHTVGFIGLDGIEKYRNGKPKQELIICIFHPETTKAGLWQNSDINTILAMLSSRKERLLFIKSNADAGGRAINDRLDWFQLSHSEHVNVYDNIPHKNFLPMLSTAKVVIGNSSVGIYEAPALGTPTIDIGLRQSGRTKADSIISCNCTSSGITEAFAMLDFPRFKNMILNREYSLPYGSGQNISETILEETKEWMANLR